MILKKLYGGNPLYLLGYLALFGLVGYSVFQVFDQLQTGKNFLVWLVGAVILHDVILLPIYSSANTVGTRLLGSVANYVRVPLGLSLILAIAFFGTISGKGEAAYRNTSTKTYDGYFTRWLIVSAAMFLVSGLLLIFKKMGEESEPASPPESQPPH